MKKIFFGILFFFSLGCAQEKKAWTIFVYLAARNNLYPYSHPNLEQMMHAGSNEDRDIIVYFAELKDDLPGGLVYIEKDLMTYLSHETGVDSGAKTTCLNACKKTFMDYPADHYAFIFWNHGTGALNISMEELCNRGIAYDDLTHNYLSDQDVIDILKEISEETLGGKKIDILAFDACLMAGIEFQTSCAPYVHYYVASQENEDCTGWNYDAAFSPIGKNSSPAEVSTLWVHAYGGFYEGRSKQYTQSAIDASVTPLISKNINDIGALLSQLLTNEHADTIRMLLNESLKEITCFDNPDNYDYVDLDHLFSNMLCYIEKNKLTGNQIEQLCQLLSTSKNLISQAVIANSSGSYHVDAKGISIYFPNKIFHDSYKELAWTKQYPEWGRLIEHINR
jgi:hypothetical protein